MVFQCAGVANAGTQEQLKSFFHTLRRNDKRVATMPTDWIDAFEMLISYLDSIHQARKVVFIDELPWMDTQGAQFVSALEHFWNSWASARHDIILIVCGSATSWMMDKLINNHGGLYGRLTHRIFLSPFTLSTPRAVPNPTTSASPWQTIVKRNGRGFTLRAVRTSHPLSPLSAQCRYACPWRCRKW